MYVRMHAHAHTHMHTHSVVVVFYACTCTRTHTHIHMHTHTHTHMHTRTHTHTQCGGGIFKVGLALIAGWQAHTYCQSPTECIFFKDIIMLEIVSPISS